MVVITRPPHSRSGWVIHRSARPRRPERLPHPDGRLEDHRVVDGPVPLGPHPGGGMEIEDIGRSGGLVEGG